MFKSAAEELTQWADQCRRWAKGARTREQRLTLQSLERLLDDAAIEAELDAGADAPLALTPTQRS
ncbi:MAG TPA: hypothetical protein VL048_09450 [Xanthobacteraceae bacterium]|jgi:hypothetical protein|nr:hypothetical protein [Xanthobacteraceae bacterium]